jgi:hypothetical protein
MDAAPHRETVWDASPGDARVYVAGRKWVSSDGAFLDDLGDDRLRAMVSGLLLATPGHLGESVER